MRTPTPPLSYACMSNRLAECSWLMCAAVIPLATEPAASSLQAIFFAPKFVLTSTAAAMAWCAFSLHLLQKSQAPETWRPLLLILPVMLAAFAADRWSVDPSRSHAVSALPMLGLWSWVVYGGVLVSVATFLRTREQLGRLIWALLLPAFPIGLSVLLMSAGVMPRHFAPNFLSPAGSHLFTASYLVFILPVAVVQLALRWRDAGDRLNRGTLLSALLVVILVSAFLVCEKRGPMLALLTAGCVGLCLLARVTRRTRWAKGAGVVAILAAAFLTLLAALQQFGLPVRDLPMVGRLAMIVPLGEETGDAFRQSLWSRIPGLVFKEDPVNVAGVGPDVHHALRPWLGYGPNTIEAVLPSAWIWLPAWPRHIIEVSTHSQFWDILLCFGILGLAAYWLLVLFVFREGMSLVGGTPLRKHPLLLGIPLLGGGAGGALLTLVNGGAFFGTGFVGGFLVSTVVLTWVGRTQEPQAQAPASLTLWAIAFMAALSGHLVDMAFLFPRGSTSMLFAVYCGVALAMPQIAQRAPAKASSPNSQIFSAVIIPVAFLALVHSLMPPWETNWSQILRPWPLATTVLLLAAFGVYARMSAREEPASGPAPGMETALAAAILAATYLGLREWVFPAWTATGRSDAEALLLPAVFFAALCVLASGPLRGGATRDRWPALAAILAAAIGLVWSCSFLRGELAAGIAFRDPSSRQILLQHALNLVPENFRWRVDLADSFQVKAPPAEDEGTKVLQTGVNLSALNMLTMHLGKRRLQQAVLAEDANTAETAAAAALANFQTAAVYNPANADAWFHSAMTGDLLADVPPKAVEAWSRRSNVALAGTPPLMPEANLARWGGHYASLALEQSDEPLRLTYASRALELLEKAILKLNEDWEQTADNQKARKHLGEILFTSWLDKGHMHKIRGEYGKAALAYRQAARVEMDRMPVDPLHLAEECERLQQQEDSEPPPSL